MPDIPNKLRSTPGIDSGNAAEARREALDSREVKETTTFGRTAVETLDGIEDGAEAMGEVSETISEDRKKSSGSAKAGSAAQDPMLIKEKLLQSHPNEKLMKKQIEREIKKEVKYLHKKAMRMLSSPSEINYFEMSNLMKKIRELKGILLTLVKSSLESVKTLWLRYVHGIM